MTRTRLERLTTRPCPATTSTPHPHPRATVGAALRCIQPLPCGCWLVTRPDGELIVPCDQHDNEGWLWQ
jgi:hypothetical protein